MYLLSLFLATISLWCISLYATFLIEIRHFCIINHFIPRTVTKRLARAVSSTTRDCRTVRLTTTPRRVRCAPHVRSPSPVGVSRPCLKSFTPSISCVLSAWNNWTREHSRSTTTSRTATRALSNCSDKLRINSHPTTFTWIQLLHIIFAFLAISGTRAAQHAFPPDQAFWIASDNLVLESFLSH